MHASSEGTERLCVVSEHMLPFDMWDPGTQVVLNQWVLDLPNALTVNTVPHAVVIPSHKTILIAAS